MAATRTAAPAGAAPLVAVAILSLAAVGAALISQHTFDMQPCPWCVLQRLIFVAIALVCIVGALIRSSGARAGAGVLAALLALCGVGAALWQHFQAAKSASCKLTLADKILNATTLPSVLPDVFEPRASCADAAVSLLGVSYDLWSLALFVVIVLIASRAWRTRR